MQCVLMFHGVGEPSEAIPTDELPYWVSQSRFSEFVRELPQASEHFVWTFDDGNASDLQAAHELESAGLSGKFFVLSGRVGRKGYLCASHLRELDAMGMEVGSHGRDHIDWRKADDRTLENEIEGSRMYLEDILGRSVDSIAIPFGFYNKRVFRWLEDSMVRRVYTSDTGLSRCDARFVRRNPVKSYDGLKDVIDVLHDRIPASQRFRRTIMPMIKRAIL